STLERDAQPGREPRPLSVSVLPDSLPIQTRIANERYLRTHKEVELLLSGFFRETFLKRPDNILEFAADYFTDPGLPNKIHMQLIEDKKSA
uniref:Regulatory subunit of type II PKA R-subunit domain containing 1 n=1 Tax=Spermophilus dauricus TaxID=99837 RepID=A0A8C9Q970_SPEDA